MLSNSCVFAGYARIASTATAFLLAPSYPTVFVALYFLGYVLRLPHAAELWTSALTVSKYSRCSLCAGLLPTKQTVDLQGNTTRRQHWALC